MDYTLVGVYVGLAAILLGCITYGIATLKDALTLVSYFEEKWLITCLIVITLGFSTLLISAIVGGISHNRNVIADRNARCDELWQSYITFEKLVDYHIWSKECD
jgi:hypothetical protein